MTTTATAMIDPNEKQEQVQQTLTDTIVFSKYARFKPTMHRREVRNELLDRYKEMLLTKYPLMQEEIHVAMQYAYDSKIVPSMRALQFAGPAINGNNNRIYNCAYMAMDHSKAFSEAMYLLLGGTGVGYSVQQRHVNQLPIICNVVKKPLQQFTIPDSIEGWAEAIAKLMDSYMQPHKPFYILDYSLIRDKGQPIHTAGGFAPGSEPLKETVNSVNNILYNAQGRQLKPIEVFDINNYIAQAVYSGGIRRSATICLFDRWDHAMLDSKSGQWYINNPERAMANISAVLPKKEVNKDEFNSIFHKTQHSGSGEPGFYWTNDPDLGANPCAEISLRSNTFCNLSELNVSNITDQEDFVEAAKAATVLGTLQAGFINLKQLRPIWTQRTKEDSLIGVSLTGIASYNNFPFNMPLTVEQMKITNRDIASNIGINPAKRLTTIKPSGTASLYFGTSSGIHPYHSPYYIRRMRIQKTDELSKVFQQVNPNFIEEDVMDNSNNVISFPLKAPDNAVTSEEGSLEMLRRIRFFYNEWIKPGHIDGLNTNNTSATVYVRPDEWDSVKQFLWENRDHYHGLTVLPYTEHSYKQTPFEEITAEQYYSMLQQFQPIDFTTIDETVDHTNPSGEVACSGGACEIKQL